VNATTYTFSPYLSSIVLQIINMNQSKMSVANRDILESRSNPLAASSSVYPLDSMIMSLSFALTSKATLPAPQK
jgi:hypothetical protein